MGRFVGELDTRTVSDGYILLSPFTYVTDEGQEITAPPGFKTDLASIPRIARPIFTGHGKSRKPATIHDWLYAQYHDPRKEADLIFLECLETIGMNWMGRQTMYYAVRAGGWKHYMSEPEKTDET